MKDARVFNAQCDEFVAVLPDVASCLTRRKFARAKPQAPQTTPNEKMKGMIGHG